MSAKPWYDEAVSAYQALRRETTEQFQFLVGGRERGGLGVTVEIVDYDPYADATAMAEDLKDRRLKIYSSNATGNPHPFFSHHENDMFRALHDAFGHAASGCGFDRDGEEAAWLSQWRLYSPLARLALATETRGQSCAQAFYFGGKKFPEQKLMLLPRQLTEPGGGAIRLVR